MAAGQELLVRYGGANWFEVKNIPYADVDYASTIWRPNLHPLPCRQRVGKTKGEDGRPRFAVLVDTILPGTVVEISICVEVSVIVVDQFPVLWDFVIMDAVTQQVCALEDAEVCWKPVYSYEHISLCQNPAGMRSSVLRRANPNHTQFRPR